MRSLLLCVSATVLAAQEQPTPPTFHTEANYVRVDVYPTRDGAPVADLRLDDFEVLEDKVPQKLEQFEHITIRSAAGLEVARREPNNLAESRQAAEDPRARVFVLFLDVGHVDAADARTMRKPLIDMLDRVIGPDDLIAVMTPDMSARDITFARGTTTIEGILSKLWGERDHDIRDPVEERYAACYPGIPLMNGVPPSDQGIAQEMILRRREERTLDALEDLVTFLGTVREERKAILTLSDGWRLFRPNDGLTRPITDRLPQGPTIGVDPRNGRLTSQDTQNPNAAKSSDCERDRIALAQLNDEARLREIVDEANRANASFYTFDPRGLVVFDEQIVPSSGVGVGILANQAPMVTEDASRLTARHTSLRALAENTDGLALIETSDFARGLQRMTNDLSSYYLLGYYSRGKLDGKFHAITVSVKRTGVQVRARRGYLAASAAALTATAPTASRVPVLATAAGVEIHAVETAIGSLAASSRDVPLRLQSAAGWTPAGAAMFWTVVEAGRATENGIGGGQADAMLVDRSGKTVAAGHADIDPGAVSVRVSLTSSSELAAGEYELRVRVKGTGSPTASTESMSITLTTAPAATGVMVARRGPTTGNKDVPTADPRFRRTERLRVDVPTPSGEAVTARLLDRAGKPLPVPVAASVRDDPDGSRWRTAQLTLAALAPGDYIIEVTSGGERTLAAFRVVP